MNKYKFLTIVLIALILIPFQASFALYPISTTNYGSSSSYVEGFRKISDKGFTDFGGDEGNAYAWSMGYFNGDLYIGTGRASSTFCIMAELIAGATGGSPSDIPDIDCPPFLQEWLDLTTLPFPTITNMPKFFEWRDNSYAEIWRYHNGQWTRVYKAKTVTSYLLPTFLGVPEAAGFRKMETYTDIHGQEAIYAGVGGLNFALSPTLILRSTDGINWFPVPTHPAMGRDTRAMAVHNGKLCVGTGSIFGGAAQIWCSNDPSAGSWTMVANFDILDSDNTNVVSLYSWRGYLYAGTQNAETGFEVWRSTVANPSPSPSNWKRIVNYGAGDMCNGWAGTMEEFKGHLYVGSLSIAGLSPCVKGFDLIRIDKNDNWRLIIGDYEPHIPPPGGPYRRYPLSMHTSGFGNPVNFYDWTLEEYKGRLYLGTFDAGVFLRYLGEDIIPLRYFGGADLKRSSDGIHWTTVTLHGFENRFNYGFRTMLNTPKGLFIGTANPFQGCEVWFKRSFFSFWR